MSSVNGRQDSGAGRLSNAPLSANSWNIRVVENGLSTSGASSKRSCSMTSCSACSRENSTGLAPVRIYVGPRPASVSADFVRHLQIITTVENLTLFRLSPFPPDRDGALAEYGTSPCVIFAVPAPPIRLTGEKELALTLNISMNCNYSSY